MPFSWHAGVLPIHPARQPPGRLALIRMLCCCVVKLFPMHSFLPAFFRFHSGLLVACLQLLTSDLAPAQVPSILKNALGGQETSTQSAAQTETPEQALSRLNLWQKEAREQLAALEEQPPATLPQGISAGDLEERRRTAEQTILSINRAIKGIDARNETNKTLTETNQRAASWQGFPTPPPYSILLVDELLNERDALKEKLTSTESSLSVVSRTLTSTLAEAKSSEDSLNQLLSAAEKTPKEHPDHPAILWRVESAKAQARLFAARVHSLQSATETAKLYVAVNRAELAFVDRKIASAKANSHFSQSDLDKLAKIASERKSVLRKEIETIAKRQKSAIAIRKSAQTSLDEVSSQNPQPPAPQIELAKFRLEVADFRIEALQSCSENLESLITLENTALNAYQDRYLFLHPDSPNDAAKALVSLTTIADRLKAWEVFSNNEIDRASADLAKLESKAVSITTEDPRFALLNDQRASISEKQVVLQRMSQAVSSQRRQVQRWIKEFSPKEDSLMAGVTNLGTTLAGWARAFWALEVTSSEQTFEFEGQTITRKIPVTLGQLIWAAGAFAVLYFIATRVVSRIQTTIVTRGHLANAQANTLRNWLMIVIGVALAALAFNLIGIPLTVFAFFGGALAIGLGFGTQTLIKNFISGIIMLFERKIRVGDVLDLGGVIGTVTEINTRSSVIRSGDGVETLVPNSTFLENRITNLTLTDRQVRRTIRVGTDYNSSPRKVMVALKECIDRHGLVLKEPEPFVVFADFGDNALLFDLYFWLESNERTNPIVVCSDIRLMIDKRLKELGVAVPFPQREMHLSTESPIQIQYLETRRDSAEGQQKNPSPGNPISGDCLEEDVQSAENQSRTKNASR